MRYVVYGEWRSGSPVGEEVGTRLQGAFRPTGESVEIWASPDDPQVLMVAFEVEADTYEAALDAARAELLAAGQAAPLDGTLTRVTSMTDEGYRTWSA